MRDLTGRCPWAGKGSQAMPLFYRDLHLRALEAAYRIIQNMD